jgi:hypothetical protein
MATSATRKERTQTVLFALASIRESIRGFSKDVLSRLLSHKDQWRRGIGIRSQLVLSAPSIERERGHQQRAGRAQKVVAIYGARYGTYGRRTIAGSSRCRRRPGSPCLRPPLWRALKKCSLPSTPRQGCKNLGFAVNCHSKTTNAAYSRHLSHRRTWGRTNLISKTSVRPRTPICKSICFITSTATISKRISEGVRHGRTDRQEFRSRI